jgi:hypothetical protein
MSDIARVPRSDFAVIRECEDIIFRGLCEPDNQTGVEDYPSPPTVVYDYWSSNHLEPGTKFNTTSFSAEHTLPPRFFGKAKRRMLLALYDIDDVDEVGIARVFDIELTRGRERFFVYPVCQKLGATGIHMPYLKNIRAPWTKLLKEEVAFTRPNAEDVQVVREQLERGALRHTED